MEQTQPAPATRATFHRITPRQGVRPTARELRWLKHLERHGPQPSDILYALTTDTHRCQDTALRDLQKLRAGGFLRLPPQQRATARAEFNPYIYDLTRDAHDHLAGVGLAEPTFRPTGHCWHTYLTALVTGSLDIVATRQGLRYIPGHEILARTGATLAIPIGAKHLIPDQLFALQYPDGYRAFLLEIDRGTEPLRSAKSRKSLAQSLDLYRQMFTTQAHRHHYGLRATTLVLWVFEVPGRMAQFQKLVQERAGANAGRFLCKALPERRGWEEMEAWQQVPWSGGGGMVEVVG
ncbi:MAG: replication-relaxation family protein [Pseudomonadota bacterium]